METIVEYTVETEETIKDRLTAAFEELVEQSDIKGPLVKLAAGMFTNFLNNADNESIKKMLLLMRDELIPFILGEDDKNQEV